MVQQSGSDKFLIDAKYGIAAFCIRHIHVFLFKEVAQYRNGLIIFRKKIMRNILKQ